MGNSLTALTSVAQLDGRPQPSPRANIPGIDVEQSFQQYKRVYYHLAARPEYYTVINDDCILLATELIVKEHLHLISTGAPADGHSVFAWFSARVGSKAITTWSLYSMDAIASPATGRVLQDLANLAQDKICPTPGLLSPCYRGEHLHQRRSVGQR